MLINLQTIFLKQILHDQKNFSGSKEEQQNFYSLM